MVSVYCIIIQNTFFSIIFHYSVGAALQTLFLFHARSCQNSDNIIWIRIENPKHLQCEDGESFQQRCFISFSLVSVKKKKTVFILRRKLNVQKLKQVWIAWKKWSTPLKQLIQNKSLNWKILFIRRMSIKAFPEKPVDDIRKEWLKKNQGNACALHEVRTGIYIAGWYCRLRTYIV